MKLTVVSFEVAKMILGIGFTDKINRLQGKEYYNYLGVLNGDSLMELKSRNRIDANDYANIPAPTLELVKLWLALNKELFVETKIHIREVNDDALFMHQYCIKRVVEYKIETFYTVDGFGSDQKALEAGIIKACEYLLNL